MNTITAKATKVTKYSQEAGITRWGVKFANLKQEIIVKTNQDLKKFEGQGLSIKYTLTYLERVHSSIVTRNVPSMQRLLIVADKIKKVKCYGHVVHLEGPVADSELDLSHPNGYFLLNVGGFNIQYKTESGLNRIGQEVTVNFTNMDGVDLHGFYHIEQKTAGTLRATVGHVKRFVTNLASSLLSGVRKVASL